MPIRSLLKHFEKSEVTEGEVFEILKSAVSPLGVSNQLDFLVVTELSSYTPCNRHTLASYSHYDQSNTQVDQSKSRIRQIPIGFSLEIW